MEVYDIAPVRERTVGTRTLTERDVAALREYDDLSVERRDDGNVEIVSQRYVGVVGLPSGSLLEVAPKANCDFLYLLAYVGDLDETLVRDAEAGWDRGRSFVDELAALYATELGRVVDRGIHHEYRTRRGSHRRARGRLDVRRQLRHGPAPTTFECEYRTRTAETTANRALLYAAKQLLGVVSRTSVERLLRQHVSELERVVSHEPVSVAEVEALTTNRLNNYYDEPLRLAAAVIEGGGIDPLRAPGRTYQSVLVNVERRFEEAVVRAVTEAVDSSTYEVTDELGTLLEGDNHGPTQRLEPDFVVEERDGEVALVGDAKWKTGVQTPDRTDLYQLVAYQRHADAPGMLVYPTDPESEPDTDVEDEYQYRGAARNAPPLLTGAFPISGHRSYEAFADEVTNWMASRLREAGI